MLKQSTRDILRCIARRSSSTRSNPFPYPPQPHPQPHQIFHLPRSATQRQIKERYYDLVRIYHPDSPIGRKYPPDVAQARFQSISKAYDLLRGKSAITGEVLTNRERHADPGRFRPRAARRPHFDETAGDERWKERVFLGATVLAIGAFVMQTTVSRQKVIAQATGRGRTHSSGDKYSPLTDEALVEPTESARSR